MTLRRTGRTSLLFVIAVLACSDDDPAAPDLALEPSNYITPYTGAACGESNCLPGNIVGGWGITTGYSSSYTFTPWNVDARTDRGSSVTAGFCITRKSDGYSLGCQMIENWSQAGPYLGTGAVKIVGMDVQNRHRLYFDGFAPRPTIELLEFDRPETVSCNTTYMKCTGPFRLKIDLRDSDWYRSDHIYLYAVMPDGTELYLQPDYVQSGTTFEWTWTKLQGPGYRLLVRYRPWDGSDDWMMEFSVPISDASPQLTLEALESPGGPAVTQVPAGTSVFFTASAPGATSIDSLRWHWTPSDPTVTPQTAACAPDEISCTVAVLEDGTMHVAARVDGQTRAATAPVGVVTPELHVTANPTRIVAGTSVQFTASAVGGDITNIEWQWDPDPSSGLTAECLAGEISCIRAVHESGWMTATADVGGAPCAPAKAYVTVICNFFANQPQDPLLQDTTVQRIFSDLWIGSNPGDKHIGIERGGYLVRRDSDGRIDLVPYVGPADLCSVKPVNGSTEDLLRQIIAIDSGNEILGLVHTHPMTGTYWTNDNGRCAGAEAGRVTQRSDPSPEDEELIGLLRHYDINVDAYAINHDNVIAYRALWDDGTSTNQPPGVVNQSWDPPLPRNTACVVH